MNNNKKWTQIVNNYSMWNYLIEVNIKDNKNKQQQKKIN